MREQLFSEEFRDEVAKFVTKHRGGDCPVKVFLPLRKRGFSIDYRVKYSDGHSVLAHFLLPGFSQFAGEKVHAEVAALKYIAKNTTIPVPTILYYGLENGSIGGLGPFIIMSYIEHSRKPSNVLAKPDRIYGEYIPGVLAVMDLHMDEQRLGFLYGQVAEVLLQLARCNFPQIGSLGVFEGNCSAEDSIVHRPMSFGLAEFGRGQIVPRTKLPAKPQTFSSSTEYFSVLADMHLQ